MRRTAALASLLVVLLAAASPAIADDSRVGGDPGNVHIEASDDIRMEAETVQAVVYQGFAEYVVDFAFLNSGPEQEVRLGFPFGLDDKSGDRPPLALAGFLAYQGDEPLEVTLTTGRDGPYTTGWFEHTATFPPGRTMIQVRYVTRPGVSMGLPDGVSENAPAQYRGMPAVTGTYSYTLHTGSGWAGTIGRAVVRYSLAEDFEGWDFGADGYVTGLERWGTRPRGFSRPDDRTLQWIFEEFEPVLDEQTGQCPYDILAMYYLPIYSWEGTTDEPADPAWARPPVVDVAASSVSPALEYDEPKHPADRAIDGDPVSAWVSEEGFPGDPWLRLSLGEPRKAGELRIVSGYARTPGEYREHGRPKTIEIRFPDGTATVETLADEPTVQRIGSLGGHDISEVTVVVTDTYPGTKYDDVAIAEVEIGSVAAPRFRSFDEVLAAQGPVVTEEDLTPLPAELAEETTAEAAPDPEPDPDPAQDTPDAGVWIAIAAAVIGGSIAGMPAVRQRRRRGTTPDS